MDLTLWIALGLAVVVVWGLFVFNRLVQLRNRGAGSWADIDVQLKRRHDLVDPLTRPRCREKMKLLAFIFDPAIIRRILDHLEHKAPPRAPPEPSALIVH